MQSESWLRLIDGLIKATQSNTLRWEIVAARSGSGTAGLSLMITDGFSASRIFRGWSVAHDQRYELKAADSYGRAPFELSVWEKSSQPEGHSIGTLKSSVHVADASAFQLNQRLEALYKAVDNSIESEEEVVNRLLKGLGQ